MNRRKTLFTYLAFDVVAACLSWFLFFCFRKQFIEADQPGFHNPIEITNRLYLALVLLPLFWLTLYFVTGYYSHICRKARLIELGQTFFTSLAGVVFLFFLILLDDVIRSHQNYYYSFFVLFGLHFSITYFFRLVHTTRITHRIHKRKIGFNTLLIGNNPKAVELYHQISNQRVPSGKILIGYIRVNDKDDKKLASLLPCLGTIEQLDQLIKKHKVEEAIVTVDTAKHSLLSQILIPLQKNDVLVWGIPDLYDILSGNKKTNNPYDEPLFRISNGIMPEWETNVKRIIDVSFSVIAMVVSIPLFLIIPILILIDSKGPIIYSQTRIGRYGKPFRIYKFRSMICDAEANGPKLSCKNDPRITKLGLFLRKSHLDEIPQFFNVLTGHMSLVGPRPERQHYIDLLTQQAPQYALLQRVRPGITSWGQIKYGYASDLTQMLERLPYDLVYMKNASLYLDFKILIYSFIEVIRAKGK